MSNKNLGYDDTPVLQDSEYKVHDGNRPQPKVVTPGDFSSAGEARKAAVRRGHAFDGQDLSGWIGCRITHPRSGTLAAVLCALRRDPAI